MAMNPYNWQSHSPRIQVPRADVGRAAELLASNGSAVVLGGRGMGKSVFLGQLQAALERTPGVRVLSVPGPPAELTVRAAMTHLARVLGVAAGDVFYSRDLFTEFFSRPAAPERLVLLFDEFDRYAPSGVDADASQPAGRGFFNDLEASRRSLPQLGILATGSIGVFVFRDVLGSSFLARALHLRLKPFQRAELELLARPFAARGTALRAEVLDSLLLASGGLPALLTYGLQQLWPRAGEPSERDVTTAYAQFQEEHAEYLRDLLGALADPRLSDAPHRIWEYVQSHGGPVRRAALREALGEPSGALNLDLADVLHLLEAVGLVRLGSSAVRDDPVVVDPIASLLNLPGPSTPGAGLGDHVRADLQTLLAALHRSSADFFRPGDAAVKGGAGKQLVPESVFCAHLALGFEMLGWRVEREAQRGAGRTDLVVRRNGARETAVVEVKIWGRHDYREAHRQVVSYWTAETAAGAVVQLTDAALPDWPERYRRDCLEPLAPDVSIEQLATERLPLAAHFSATSAGAGETSIRIDHLLLRLARRS